MTTYSKYFEKVRIRPDPQAASKAQAPCCQWDGCNEPGTHRAPVGRMKEGEYFRFCFDHVREYNKGFNYFSGVAENDIARFQKEALTGHRPTWKMGTGSTSRPAADFSQMRSGRAGYYRMRDPYNMFGTGTVEPQARKAKPLEAKALDTLGLTVKATAQELKARYKLLVKQHHPDANGGDRGSEDRLREVIQAYKLLKQAGYC
ncbi:J domain-containing protein [Tianweitania sediminis]|jgi:curved DNA-binding protein CbpA|uniref:J domain-containing protein n=1 Tax=Tianweitania sediminis TaxID=1502156 RepID=A0A8J7UHI9_9HYPH|nr:J domain-containing protein [Tianweitania sediminis]MBP0437868.1 J domain-containing protein [Tianweitania sediminis]HEV7418109.1 J domain-containing protein [Tianweitania sediminis]